ncbi:hypothetical protein [Candidatus Curculioniphilus buchneri]
MRFVKEVKSFISDITIISNRQCVTEKIF